MRTTPSGFGRRLPFTMLFARLCELTMGSPAPYARWNINGFRVDVLSFSKESERLCHRSHSRGRGVLVGKIALGLGVLAVVVAFAGLSVVGAAAGRTGFTTPTVMGFPPAGDDWEPAVASDGLGNVYVLSTHLSGIPGCTGCSIDSIVVQVSHNGGKSFSSPVPLTVNSAVQFDPKVKVNAAGEVFVSYLLGKDTVVA